MNSQDLLSSAKTLAQVTASHTKEVFQQTENYLAIFSPFQLIGLTLVTAYCIYRLLLVYEHVRRFGILSTLFEWVVQLPIIRTKVAMEELKLKDEYYAKYKKDRPDSTKVLPDKPMSKAGILAKFKVGEQTHKTFWKDGGRASGAVYHSSEEHWQFINECMKMYDVSNPLHIEEFGSVVQMEAEIIRMVINLYKGDFEACGVVTSGGTESILLACLAYREKARAERGITRPNMVMSHTAHAAFDKAAFYFGIELRKVPQTKDLRCDVAAIKKQIDRNTIMLVGSGPEYPFGNYDPIPTIAAIAQQYGIGCHSDCCLGSFTNAFTEKAGFKLPCKVDFTVPGVTSISCDPHKYGCGPKGLSIVMFKEAQLRNYQFFATMKWPGGFYATTCMAGSRPGAVIAGTWACLMSFGKRQYLENTKEILTACQKLKERLRDEVPEVRVATRDDSSVVAIVNNDDHPDKINCIALGEVLAHKHRWFLSKVQYPAGLHISVHMASCKDLNNLVDCIKASIQEMKEKPELNHSSLVATYGMAAKVPDGAGAFLNRVGRLHSSALLDAL